MAQLLEIDLAERFNCDDCAALNLQRARNCDGTQEDAKILIHPDGLVPNFHVDRCPNKYVTPETILDFEDCVAFTVLGHLPYGGGFMDQPNRLVELMVLYKCLHNSYLYSDEYRKYMEDKQKQSKELGSGGHQGGIAPQGAKITNMAQAKARLAEMQKARGR